ncbi:hypothetical protein TruAng_006614 [Truncatella angustata]|nr:hypothetical protein TruAng_006614 [Truncatella angustata]
MIAFVLSFHVYEVPKTIKAVLMQPFEALLKSGHESWQLGDVWENVDEQSRLQFCVHIQEAHLVHCLARSLALSAPTSLKEKVDDGQDDGPQFHQPNWPMPIGVRRFDMIFTDRYETMFECG